jgi:hypothetical protein
MSPAGGGGRRSGVESAPLLNEQFLIFRTLVGIAEQLLRDSYLKVDQP